MSVEDSAEQGAQSDDAVPARSRLFLAASAMFVVFSYPLVQRWGRRPTNSSALPLNYGRNLVIILLIVWTLAAVTIVARVIRSRRADGQAPAR